MGETCGLIVACPNLGCTTRLPPGEPLEQHATKECTHRPSLEEKKKQQPRRRRRRRRDSVDDDDDHDFMPMPARYLSEAEKGKAAAVTALVLMGFMIIVLYVLLIVGIVGLRGTASSTEDDESELATVIRKRDAVTGLRDQCVANCGKYTLDECGHVCRHHYMLEIAHLEHAIIRLTEKKKAAIEDLKRRVAILNDDYQQCLSGCSRRGRCMDNCLDHYASLYSGLVNSEGDAVTCRGFCDSSGKCENHCEGGDRVAFLAQAGCLASCMKRDSAYHYCMEQKTWICEKHMECHDYCRLMALP